MNRRDFLAAGASLLAPALSAAGPEKKRPRVAAIYTVFRRRSHAFNILENFLLSYLFNGKVVESGMEIASFYADQRAEDGDLTDATARRFKIPVFATIEEALTLGGKDLAVDAVLSIGEHGAYGENQLGQALYPRKRFFDEITAVMRRSRRFVPLFNDKHLSYRWDWAKEMYDVASAFRIPFLAGSSVPLAQRRPALDIPQGAVIEEALAMHGGGVETYDFHGFEVLQSFVEKRKGGETGITHVEFLEGEALWKAAQERRWSLPLAQAALAAEFGKDTPDLRRPLPREKDVPAHALLLTYRDGLRATVLQVGQKSTRWNFACQLAGAKQIRATSLYTGPWGNRNLFMALSHAIQQLFLTGTPPYPVERTLLASGVLDAAMHGRAERRAMRTPHLEFAYQPPQDRDVREQGASWTILDKVAESKGLGPMGEK